VNSFKDYYYIQEEGLGSKLKALGLAGSLALTGFGKEMPPQQPVQQTQTVKKDISIVTPDSIKSQLIKHEGYKRNPYYDSEKKLTVGIGFNIDEPSNRNVFYKVTGLNPSKVTTKTLLTDKQIDDLYRVSYNRAVSDARKFLPSYDSQPLPVKKVLVDMSFNLGYPRLSKFTKFKDALEKRDYKRASKEMLDSKWSRQVKSRATNLASMVSSSN
jgi:lysozyme